MMSGLDHCSSINASAYPGALTWPMLVMQSISPSSHTGGFFYLQSIMLRHFSTHNPSTRIGLRFSVCIRKWQAIPQGDQHGILIVPVCNRWEAEMCRRVGARWPSADTRRQLYPPFDVNVGKDVGAFCKVKSVSPHSARCGSSLTLTWSALHLQSVFVFGAKRDIFRGACCSSRWA